MNSFESIVVCFGR